MEKKIAILSGRVSQGLAKKVCQILNLKLIENNLFQFSDGEMAVKIEGNIRGKNTYIINSTNPPTENLIETLLLVDSVRNHNPLNVTLIIPYFGYSRQDRIDATSDSINAKVMAKLISAIGADNVILIDIHSEQILGFFERGIRVKHIEATNVIADQVKKKFKGKRYILASPDLGGVKRVKKISEKIGSCQYVIFTKSRPKPNQVDRNAVQIIGEIKGKETIFIDDMIDTGGTLANAARIAKERGATKVHLYATHGLFSGEAWKKLKSDNIDSICVCNTLPLNCNLTVGNIRIEGEIAKIISEENSD